MLKRPIRTPPPERLRNVHKYREAADSSLPSDPDCGCVARGLPGDEI
jgi:hypothetical protein